ncbi:Cytochrome b561 [Durusdinium trenchii]|uniref:DM13 and DOMON domain-containing protein At5g54830 (Protein b561A.tha1) n=1 Tax=Durusdinium trenchii TaxID=1381693 RepID=A0ABP0SEK9_9DINO
MDQEGEQQKRRREARDGVKEGDDAGQASAAEDPKAGGQGTSTPLSKLPKEAWKLIFQLARPAKEPFEIVEVRQEPYDENGNGWIDANSVLCTVDDEHEAWLTALNLNLLSMTWWSERVRWDFMAGAQSFAAYVAQESGVADAWNLAETDDKLIGSFKGEALEKLTTEKLKKVVEMQCKALRNDNYPGRDGIYEGEPTFFTCRVRVPPLSFNEVKPSWFTSDEARAAFVGDEDSTSLILRQLTSLKWAALKSVSFSPPGSVALAASGRPPDPHFYLEPRASTFCPGLRCAGPTTVPTRAHKRSRAIAPRRPQVDARGAARELRQPGTLPPRRVLRALSKRQPGWRRAVRTRGGGGGKGLEEPGGRRVLEQMGRVGRQRGMAARAVSVVVAAAVYCVGASETHRVELFGSSDMFLEWTVQSDNCTVDARIRVPGDRWVSFGFGTLMDNGSVVLADSTGVSERSISGYNSGTVTLSTAASGIASQAWSLSAEGDRVLDVEFTTLDGQAPKLRNCASQPGNVDTIDSMLFAAGSDLSLGLHSFYEVRDIDWSGESYTDAPTDSPTESPTTSAPTTGAPTDSPVTDTPTPSPTMSPTKMPTASPITQAQRYEYAATPIPGVEFYWSLPEDRCVLSFRLEVPGDRWVSFGTGTKMSDGRVIIASQNGIGEYYMNGKGSQSIFRITSADGLEDGYVWEMQEGMTVLEGNVTSIAGRKLALPCEELVEPVRRLQGADNMTNMTNATDLSQFYNSMIFAYGSSQFFATHVATSVFDTYWAGGQAAGVPAPGPSPSPGASDPSEYYRLIEIHAYLMVGAFGGLLPLTIMMPSFKVVAHEHWFLVHRLLATSCIVLAIAGTVMAFQAVDSTLHMTLQHHVLGIVALALLFANPIIGIFRPEKGLEGPRRVWLWVHRLLATGAIAVGFAALYTGLQFLSDWVEPFWSQDPLHIFLEVAAFAFFIIFFLQFLKLVALILFAVGCIKESEDETRSQQGGPIVTKPVWLNPRRSTLLTTASGISVATDDEDFDGDSVWFPSAMPHNATGTSNVRRISTRGGRRKSSILMANAPPSARPSSPRRNSPILDPRGIDGMDAYERNIPQREAGACLLIVDPQNDFHPGNGRQIVMEWAGSLFARRTRDTDQGGTPDVRFVCRGLGEMNCENRGSLGIPSADEDAERVAKLIRENLTAFHEVFVTLDTHQRYHIAHPLFWEGPNGEHPEPFTVISLEDVGNGKWRPSRNDQGIKAWVETYLTALKKQARFQLTIWPEHCLVGTSGHCVRPVIAEALSEWEAANKSSVQYILKGNNSYTEHYSAIRAEVLRTEDPSTDLNSGLVANLKLFDQVVLCGQAKSHCVNFTVRDLAEQWPSAQLDRLVVLEDACSSVVGFEAEGTKFINDMAAKGLTVTTTAAFKPATSRGGAKVVNPGTKDTLGAGMTTAGVSSSSAAAAAPSGALFASPPAEVFD